MFSAVHCNTLIEVATNGCEDTIRCSPGDVLSFKLLAHAYHAHPVKGLQGGCSIRCLASGPSCPGGYAVGEERRSCDRGQIAFASSGAAVRRQRAFAGPQTRCDLASCLLQNPAFPFPSRVRMCGIDCISQRPKWSSCFFQATRVSKWLIASVDRLSCLSLGAPLWWLEPYASDSARALR